MFQKIMVTLDGTHEAATVLPLAAQLLPAQDAELVLVRVTPNYHVDAPVNIAARADLLRVAAGAGLAGQRVRTALLYGDVAEQIVEEARSTGAEMIAMATHGRGGLARAWLGSVTEQVLAHSPVPVLVLRAGATPHTALRTVLVPFDATPGSIAALAVAREIAAATGARIALVQVIPPLPRWGRAGISNRAGRQKPAQRCNTPSTGSPRASPHAGSRRAVAPLSGRWKRRSSPLRKTLRRI